MGPDEFYVVRVGDQDDYHCEENIYDVAERLAMFEVEGAMTRMFQGVESDNYNRRNYISLFVGDDQFQPIREITPEELTAIQEQLDYLNNEDE